MIAHDDGVLVFDICGSAGVGNPGGRGGDARSRVECCGVVGVEVVKVERNSGIVHDPLDNGLAGDGAVVGDVVVHATVGFTAEDAAGEGEATLVNVNGI